MHEISPSESGFGEVFTPAEAEIVRGSIEAVQRSAQRRHVLHIDLRDSKASRLLLGSEEFPVLCHQAETREDPVRAALTFARSRQNHAAGELPGLIAGVQLGFLAGGHGFREGTQLNNQRGSGFSMTDRGRQKTLQPGAYFCRHAQVGECFVLKEHTAGHGNQTVTRQIYLIVAVGIRDREVSVRNALGGDERENLSMIERGGDVVNLGADCKRQTDKSKQIIF